MANNIDWNDWETDNLTPLVFDKLDTILPELDFKFQKGNWYSSLKLDGTAPKERRHDKTVVKKELPGILIEAGEPARNIIKHYAETRNLQQIGRRITPGGLHRTATKRTQTAGHYGRRLRIF
jgi:hypothetical protein